MVLILNSPVHFCAFRPKRHRHIERLKIKAVKVRIIKLTSPDGTVSVLLTNLPHSKAGKSKIIDLYFKRWAVEVHYRDEKKEMEIEKFHTRTCLGIRQELFAIVTMCVISRVLMIISSPIEDKECRVAGPQFKHAIKTLASEAFVLAATTPEKSIAIFNEIISEISRVKYYKPKKPKASQPRISKGPLNKWKNDKRKKLGLA